MSIMGELTERIDELDRGFATLNDDHVSKEDVDQLRTDFIKLCEIMQKMLELMKSEVHDVREAEAAVAQSIKEMQTGSVK